MFGLWPGWVSIRAHREGLLLRAPTLLWFRHRFPKENPVGRSTDLGGLIPWINGFCSHLPHVLRDAAAGASQIRSFTDTAMPARAKLFRCCGWSRHCRPCQRSG